MKTDYLTEKQQLQQELSKYLGDIEVQKQEITEDIDVYKQALTSKYKQSVKLVNRSKTGVLILGGIYVVYLLSSAIWGAKNPPKEEYKEEVIVRAPRESSTVKQIKSSIASFLLSIAKDELKRLLKKWRND